MEAVQFKDKGLRRAMAQSGYSLKPVAGNHLPYPAPYPTASGADNEDTVFNIQHQFPCKQVIFEKPGMPEKCSDTSNASFVSLISEDDNTDVVDMGLKATQMPIENVVSHESVATTLGQNCNIKWRRPITIKDLAEKEGFVKNGNVEDLCQLLEETSAEVDKGVICNSQVLCCDNGYYEEGKQFMVLSQVSEGAHGKVVMCQDLKSGKIFMQKKVQEKVEKNEILLPFILKGMPGITEVYGVIKRGQTIEIYQEFAGMSVEKLRHSEYAQSLSKPSTVLALAFQGFKTLERLHSAGIQHLDVKPQNVCVDMGQKAPCLKLIDYGSSQMPGEVITDGLTFEYLSPESCRTLVMMAQKQQAAALKEGTDVWAMTLSLIYCLCGYHPMVFACTGHTNYPATTPEQLRDQRVQCLVKIGNMTDAEVAKLIHPEWPSVLKVLFTETLRVNPEHRWSAEKAAAFILDYLSKAAQKSLTEQLASGSGFVAASPVTEQPASVSGFVAASPAIRLRVPTAQKVQESQPSPWIVLPPPSIQLPHFGNLIPHSLNMTQKTQPCKRKCQEESSVHGCKMIRK